jgi:hypothetical protein
MGVDFDVILEHHFDESNIIDLPHRLNQSTEVAAAIVSLRSHIADFHGWNFSYLDKDPFWQWIDRTGNGWDGIDPTSIFDGSVKLFGPINSFISFERHVVWTSQPHPRWSLVWGDEECLTQVRRFVWTLAQAFGGHRAIYIPSAATSKSSTATWLIDTATIDEIEQWLFENVGPPLALKPQQQAEDTYAVDDFADLSAS